MDKFNSIDHILKQKLQNFEKSPSFDVWDKLDGMLDKHENAKKRKKMIVWYSVAASVTILIVTASLIFGEKKETVQGLAQKEKQILQKSIQGKKEYKGEINQEEKDYNPESESKEEFGRPENNSKDDEVEEKSDSKENIEDILREEQEENLIVDNQLKEDKKDPQSNSFKIKVTIKRTGIADTQTMVAENKKEPKTKTGKFFQQLNNLRTGEAPVDLEAMGLKKSDKKEIRK